MSIFGAGNVRPAADGKALSTLSISICREKTYLNGMAERKENVCKDDAPGSFFRMVRGGGKRNGSRTGKRLSFRISLTARESLEIFHGGFSPEYAPHFG